MSATKRHDAVPPALGRRAFALGALVLACGPKKTTGGSGSSIPPPDDGGDPAAPSPTDDGGDTPAPVVTAPAGPCGSRGLTLGQYDWIPADARAVVTIAVAQPQTAAALSTLADRGKSAEHGLPITFAFAITQWPIVVPVLGSLLDAIGLQPDEVVYLAPAQGPAFAWVVQSDCDLDDATARIESEWGLLARRRVEGVVCAAPPDPNAGDGTLANPPRATDDALDDTKRTDDHADIHAFPYDVVFSHGGRVALVPRGYGDAFLSALKTASSPAPGNRPRWTAALEAIDPAPVRGVLSGRALLGSAAKRAPAAMQLRVTPDETVVEALELSTPG